MAHFGGFARGTDHHGCGSVIGKIGLQRRDLRGAPNHPPRAVGIVKQRGIVAFSDAGAERTGPRALEVGARAEHEGAADFRRERHGRGVNERPARADPVELGCPDAPLLGGKLVERRTLGLIPNRVLQRVGHAERFPRDEIGAAPRGDLPANETARTEAGVGFCFRRDRGHGALSRAGVIVETVGTGDDVGIAHPRIMNVDCAVVGRERSFDRGRRFGAEGRRSETEESQSGGEEAWV